MLIWISFCISYYYYYWAHQIIRKTDSAFPTVLLRQYLSQDAFSLSIQTPHPAMPSSFTTFQFIVHYQWDTDIFREKHPEIFLHSSYVIPFGNSPSARECDKAGTKKMKTWKRMISQHTWCKNTTIHKITHAKLNDFQLLKEKLLNYHFKEPLSFHTHICTHPFSPSVRLKACFELMPSHSFSQSFQLSLSLVCFLCFGNDNWLFIRPFYLLLFNPLMNLMLKVSSHYHFKKLCQMVLLTPSVPYYTNRQSGHMPRIPKFWDLPPT